MVSRHWHRLLLISCLLSLVALVSMLVATQVEAATPHVDVMLLNSDISPASLNYLTNTINTAEHDGSQALVIEIDTPGGDLDSMKAMTMAELASTVPIITYVAPSGGRAASAGAFVTLAAPIAVMAPTTRIGASSPVTSTGGDIGSTLKKKIEKYLVSAIRGFQLRYGRNQDLAAAMVTSASSYDDTTAIKKHIVDLGAPNLAALLNEVNGRSVVLSQSTVTLHTTGDQVQTVGQSLFDTLDTFLLDPNISFLLFIVAIIGIYIEVSHPGAIIPGIVGAIALLLFLFSAGSLSPNWAGLVLMFLALLLLILDVRLPSHGALTIGAVISLIIGSLLFFNGSATYGGPEIQPLVIYLMGGVIGAIGLLLVTFIVRSQRLHVTTGVESMIGAKAVALTPLLPEGRVNYAGENWAAVLEPPTTSVDAGAEVQIVAVKRLRLHVVPLRSHPSLETQPTYPYPYETLS